MSNMKWIFSSALLIVSIVCGYFLHGVIQPCPEVSTGVIHDTLTFYFRDTVKVPVVKFVEKVDTDERNELIVQNYKEYSKGMPKIGREVKTEHGKGKITALNPLKRTVTVDFGEGNIKDIPIDDIKELKS